MTYFPLSDGDPFPGDIDAVLSLISSLQNYCAEFSDLANQVVGISTSSWVGPAAQAFEEKQATIPPKLDAASRRMEGISRAISVFASQVGEIQPVARTLAQNARFIRDELHSVQYGATQQHAFEQQQKVLAASGKPPQPWTGPNYKVQQRQLRSQLDSLQGKFNEQQINYQEVVQVCLNLLNAVSHDGLQDNFWKSAAYDANQFAKANIQIIEEGVHWAWAEIDQHLKGISQLLGFLNKVLMVLTIVVLVVLLVVAVVQPELIPVCLALMAAVTKVLGVAQTAVDGTKLGVDSELAREHRGSWETVTSDSLAVEMDVVGLLIPGAGDAKMGAGEAWRLVKPAAEHAFFQTDIKTVIRPVFTEQGVLIISKFTKEIAMDVGVPVFQKVMDRHPGLERKIVIFPLIAFPPLIPVVVKAEVE